MDFREFVIEKIKKMYKEHYKDLNLIYINWIRKEAGREELIEPTEETLSEFLSQLDNQELYMVLESQHCEYFR